MTPPRNSDESNGKSGRRDELLEIAAGLFADRGVRATTVRDIADAAGILSGSLYHHFDSKESMVDEILHQFLDELFGKYREIVAAGLDSRATLEALVVTSYEAIDASHSAVAIYQDEVKHLVGNERFAYLAERNTEFRDLWVGVLEAGVADGTFRSDIDVELVFRFMRDTVWVAVRWYRPGGSLSAHAVAAQYLAIVLDGLSDPATTSDAIAESTSRTIAAQRN
ncbi:TetR/AcrR family transcriptional regulator [Rhodococcus qingshengii]|jgi:AcrR family transcriptional regulator|uniref:TetR family transcriptional regulator n=4 Tax=Rhodococcus erythropolis group TaxID=2840174 RepID=A0A1F2PZD7_RHOER|nr:MULTISPECIES: TetR/AcrR family transcriptional regulator [Rhodococcus]EEN84710.1 transcriptional regulator, TetR family [Rhodococcus erythropolis SK121]ERB54875.1 TetR family transcriptional regulator [Rhodococcus sp. P27]NHE64544.1 TetR/AcrR family transcriptional regulator [Rhodococcus sp. D-46]OCC18255.1 TetR family transcriptional regulator [Prescottella equi]ALU72971.1 TetR family transcriptional regulator [Rhodococcus erythropolis R138]